MSTTKVTRDVLDATTRPITAVIEGGSIDGTPIGATTPNEGHFTNLFCDNLTVANNYDLAGATQIGSVTAKYADIAEYYQGDAAYEPGTVLKLGGEAEVTAASYQDDDVYGVVTTNPTLIMNGTLPLESKDPETVVGVALVGRVPVRVVGPVWKHDKLIVRRDYPGVAMAATTMDILAAMASHVKTWFATALVDSDEDEERLIEAALTR